MQVLIPPTYSPTEEIAIPMYCVTFVDVPRTMLSHVISIAASKAPAFFGLNSQHGLPFLCFNLL